jgi:hypothetical protein
MRSLRTLPMLVVSAFTASACAANGAPPQHAGSVLAKAPTSACIANARAQRFREMTWNEYYNEVRERAWRSGATVIWLNPPNVRVVAAKDARPSGCR